MNRTLPIMLLCLAAATTTASAQTTNAAYDQKLADSLGADDYGMRNYILVMLKTGSRTEVAKATKDSLFKGHMDNITRLADAGKLVVAGPLKKNDKTYRGIFILSVPDTTSARQLLQTDPAINAKLLDAELYEWYGSAALPIYLPFYKKVTKKEF